MSKIVLVVLVVAVQSLTSGCAVVVWSSPEEVHVPRWVTWPTGVIQPGGYVHVHTPEDMTILWSASSVKQLLCATMSRSVLSNKSEKEVSIEANFSVGGVHHCLAVRIEKE